MQNSKINFIQIIIGVALASYAVIGFYIFYRSDFSNGIKYTALTLELLLPYLLVKTKSYQSFTTALLLYVCWEGFMGEAPRNQLNETIRNLSFHVPMWFTMYILLLVNVIYSIRFLRSNDLKHDARANEYSYTGTLFGVLGIITGMWWMNFTWAQPKEGAAMIRLWSGDPKQDSATVGLLVYFAYIILRRSFTDELQRAKISAVYSVFAFPILVVLTYILPKLWPNSLHPGGTVTPSLKEMDVDNTLVIVFYPAVIAWILLGVWIAEVRTKLSKAQLKLYER